jgi:hypothetical protein
MLMMMMMIGFDHDESRNNDISITSKKEPQSFMAGLLERAGLLDFLKLSHVFWVLVILCAVVYGCVLPFNNVASSLLLERDYFIAPAAGCALVNPLNCQSDTNLPNDLCVTSQW